MQKIKLFIYFMLLLNIQIAVSQSVEINGKVVSNVSVENIHVINKTAQVFTTTNKAGEFTITAKLNDTIMFSSIQHIQKIITISNNTILIRKLNVKLEEQINKLDEVVVGKVLTGDLLSDVENVEGDPPINFFDVGIPGYKGKPATQSERRLSEAGEFKPKMLLGLLTGGIPLNPILNGVSGRTKMLKNRVKLEADDELLHNIKVRLYESFFSVYELDESKHIDFFYFCQEDENFNNRCKGKTDIEIFEFLREKLIAYKANLKIVND
ncbi:hypothetical protein BFR04_01635 [Gaetbulibacter sp. 4G1]|nr:hypothetical protein [Gaetbulibacter sp. 4G1]PIA79571.1 hypothetical protein BFR04_01635 [Gaetbulibacter sp. 4G1]